MLRIPVYCCCLLVLACCGEQREQYNKSTGPVAVRQPVALLPLGNADTAFVRQLGARLEQQLQIRAILLQAQPLPASAWYSPRSRYIADSLLVYLASRHRGKGKIVGITTQDIATRKAPHANWGVMGLGYCPGEACVISSYRVGGRNLSREKWLDRMVVLALHELGHTWSLPHCHSPHCIMRDAEGKMNLDNGNTYCGSCAKRLRDAGILPRF